MGVRTITMSHEELDRLGVICRVAERRLTQSAAATSRGLSTRQMKRLVARYRRHGAEGLVSGKRGKLSNRRLPTSVTEHVVALVREHYVDFGPTLACKKLYERHGVLVSRETPRRLMRDAGLWLPRAQRRKALQQPRARHPAGLESLRSPRVGACRYQRCLRGRWGEAWHTSDGPRACSRVQAAPRTGRPPARNRRFRRSVRRRPC